MSHISAPALYYLPIEFNLNLSAVQIDLYQSISQGSDTLFELVLDGFVFFHFNILHMKYAVVVYIPHK